MYLPLLVTSVVAVLWVLVLALLFLTCHFTTDCAYGCTRGMCNASNPCDVHEVMDLAQNACVESACAWFGGCVNGGVCVESGPDSGTCICPKEFSGVACERGPCDAEVSFGICSGHGVCYANAQGQTNSCTCEPDWTGPTCDIWIGATQQPAVFRITQRGRPSSQVYTRYGSTVYFDQPGKPRQQMICPGQKRVNGIEVSCDPV